MLFTETFRATRTIGVVGMAAIFGNCGDDPLPGAALLLDILPLLQPQPYHKHFLAPAAAMPKTSKKCRACRPCEILLHPGPIEERIRQLERFYDKEKRGIPRKVHLLCATRGARKAPGCRCGNLCFVQSRFAGFPRDNFCLLPTGPKQEAAKTQYLIDFLNSRPFYRDAQLVLVGKNTAKKEKVLAKRHDPCPVHLLNPNGSHITFDPNKIS